jgi:cytochrome P450 family 110
MSIAARLGRERQVRLPGPRGVDALASVLRFRADPLTYLTLASREHGGIVDLGFPGRLHVGVFAPDLARRVLTAPPDTVQELPPAPFSIPDARGSGVVTSSGSEHDRYRETLMRALTTRHLERYQRRFLAIAGHGLRAWEGRREIDIGAETEAMTRRAAEALLFDLDHRLDDRPDSGPDDRPDGGPGADPAQARAALDTLIRSQRSPRRAQLSALLPVDIPGVCFGGTLRRVYATLDAVVARLAGAGADCLGRSIAEVAGPRLSVAELRDNLVQLYLAGHDTVSRALAWTLYLLARHPDVQAALVEELRAVAHDPGFQALDALPLLDAAVKESLRLYPTSPFGIRYLVRPLALGGHALPAGAAIVYSPCVTHRLEREFPEPHAFRPQRFLGRKALPAYMPFAFGYSSCVGALFAQMQIKALVALVLPGFALAVAPGVEPRVACQWHGSLRHLYPREAIRLSLSPRTSEHLAGAATTTPAGGQQHASRART